MKSDVLYIGILLLVMIVGNEVYSQEIPRDKQLHLAAGASISAWTYCVGYNYYPDSKWVPPVVGISMATLAGITKESWDKLNGGPFDIKDLGATITGGIISVGIIEGIRAIVKHKKSHKKT